MQIVTNVLRFRHSIDYIIVQILGVRRHKTYAEVPVDFVYFAQKICKGHLVVVNVVAV